MAALVRLCAASVECVAKRIAHKGGLTLQKSLLWLVVAASVLLIVAGVLLISQSAPPAAANVPVPPTTQSFLTIGGDGVARIGVQELHAQLAGANPPVVWEFRSASSYEASHLPGSRLVALEEIAAAAEGLDKDLTIVTLCA